MPDLTFTPELRSLLRTNLERFDRRPLTGENRRPAAVAVVVTANDQGAAAVVLTVRAASLRHHGGQWSFPGGRGEEGESSVETALRELEEEIGLELGPGDVLGLLDDFATRSGFVMTPVVLWGPSQLEMRLDPGEVASVHLASVSEVGARRSLLIENVEGSEHPLLALAILGTTIFAPTAAILHQFSEVTVHGRSTRVAHYEQPRFAWR